MDIPKDSNTDPEKRASLELVPGDFYYENGYMVFTAQYLTRRGYCCKNACRHCPYDFKKG